MMKIGLTFPYGLTGTDLVATLKSAQATGAHSMWLYENLYGPGVFASAGFAAAVLDQMDISVGTTSPFARPPGVLAMEAASLQDFTGGRFTLGLAAANPALITGMGAEAGRPLAAVRDVIEIVRRATSGESVDHDGRRFSTRELELSAAPAHGPPSVVVGTLAPKMTAVAAGHSDGILISSHTSLPTLHAAVAAFLDSWREARRDVDPRIIVYVACSLADDVDTAIARLRPQFARAIARLPQDPTIGELLEAGGTIGRAELESLAARLLAEPERSDLVPAEVIHAHAIAATPGDLLDSLRHYARLGVTELVLFEQTRLSSREEALALLREVDFGAL